VVKLQKELPNNSVLDEFKIKVYEFQDTIPVVTALRNQSLKTSHWKDITDIIQIDFSIKDENFTLQALIL
jgi:hypothetical protein